VRQQITFGPFKAMVMLRCCEWRLTMFHIHSLRNIEIWVYTAQTVRTFSSNYCHQGSGGAAVDPSIQTGLLIQ
jgi:hypothetical protein